MKILSAIKELENVHEICGKSFKLDESIKDDTKYFCLRAKTPDVSYPIFEFGVDLLDDGWSSVIFSQFGNPHFDKFEDLMKFYFELYLQDGTNEIMRNKRKTYLWEYMILCRDDDFLNE